MVVGSLVGFDMATSEEDLATGLGWISILNQAL